MDDSAERSSAGGISGAFSQLVASVVALVRTRLELVTIEFEEERERAKSILILSVVAAVFLSLAVITLSALVLAAYWDTHPLLAILAMAVFYGAVGAGALAILSRRERPRPFAATLAELERDSDSLRGKQ
jgi:uncharacterized membrane protein YqjE